MPETDLDLLVLAARTAGAVAAAHFENDPKVWTKPGDAGPVTEADLETDRSLARILRTARPAYGWLSEESDEPEARQGTPKQFIIDPIDGTRSFISGGKDWALSLAIAGPQGIEAAVVYLPLHDRLYAAARGGGARLNDQPFAVRPTTRIEEATILATKAHWAGHNWAGGAAPPAKRSFRSSLAYRLCLVAEGRFDGMLTLRPTWEWDVAAGSLIVAEAGGRVTDQMGRPPRWNNLAPQIPGLVAAGPDIHAALRGRLAEPPVDARRSSP